MLSECRQLRAVLWSLGASTGFFSSPFRTGPQTPSPGHSGSPKVTPESRPPWPRADSIGGLSQGRTQEAEKSPGRPHLQVNGPDRPMGGEQRRNDQCKRGGGRSHSPSAASGGKGKDPGADTQPSSAAGKWLCLIRKPLGNCSHHSPKLRD